LSQPVGYYGVGDGENLVTVWLGWLVVDHAGQSMAFLVL
jgi:hypothetical protein